MKIAIAQLNPTVGDVAGNSAMVLEAANAARAAGADLFVCSELVICGYPPKDLLLRQSFVGSCEQAVRDLADQIPKGLGVVVGHPTQWDVPGDRIANAASLICDGDVVGTVQKSLLPNYDVFDERRYFRRADSVAPIEFRGLSLGIHICEDAWWPDADTHYDKEPSRFADPVTQLANAGAQVLINLSASPFEVHKQQRRQQLMAGHSQKHSLPTVFVNQIGGNDDLVFDGASFVLNEQGALCCQLAGFETDSGVVDLAELEPTAGVSGGLTLTDRWNSSLGSGDGGDANALVASANEEMMQALVLGLRDYVRKCGFTDCVLGLSGGIDSALAACIAAEALGPKHVHALLMPSRYSSNHSVDDAKQLAEALGIQWEVVPIDGVHSAFESTVVIGDDLKATATGLPEQNLQARIRGTMVMVRSNQNGWMALATGNKSELAVGYCTLYGDMCGGLAVISDLLKRDVYGLSRHVNQRAGREIIPNNIIDKPPSAELAPDQVDQDTLPPYPTLDAILEGLIEQHASVEALSKEFPRDIVEWVAKRVDRNEFKRRQMPPGIKLSPRAFGTGRRMPMAARISYE